LAVELAAAVQEQAATVDDHRFEWLRFELVIVVLGENRIEQREG
jgi:hypothetical protein